MSAHQHVCPECTAPHPCEEERCTVVHALPSVPKHLPVARGILRLCATCAPACPLEGRVEALWRERGPVAHMLKTTWTYFRAVADGTKRAEMRLDDRGFRLHDVLDLREVMPYGRMRETSHGRRLFRVTHVLRPSAGFGVMPGWIMMSISPIVRHMCPQCTQWRTDTLHLDGSAGTCTRCRILLDPLRLLRPFSYDEPVPTSLLTHTPQFEIPR